MTSRAPPPSSSSCWDRRREDTELRKHTVGAPGVIDGAWAHRRLLQLPNLKPLPLLCYQSTLLPLTLSKTNWLPQLLPLWSTIPLQSPRLRPSSSRNWTPAPLSTFPPSNMLPDTPSSTSTSTVVAFLGTPSPSLLGHLDPPSPLMPTVSPDHPVSVPDAAAPADPTTPTCQTLNVSESGLDCLPANSPLTGHASLDHLRSPVSNGGSTVPDWHIELVERTSKDGGFRPSTCLSPATIVASLEPSALEPWGSNARVVVNFIILAPYTTTRHSPEPGVQVLCTGSTPPALTLLVTPAKPVVRDHPKACSRFETHSCQVSISQSDSSPSTSGMSSSNPVPTPSTSSSPPSLPSLSNAEMLVILREALRTATEVLDKTSRGHVASEKSVGQEEIARLSILHYLFSGLQQPRRRYLMYISLSKHRIDQRFFESSESRDLFIYLFFDQNVQVGCQVAPNYARIRADSQSASVEQAHPYLQLEVSDTLTGLALFDVLFS
ncbi:hypothetical protein BKA82DRAFT_4362503 [Pisolithus tinctorius]|nr:hypothetical protein BKA82DRAFT_4362503 [Pisolithus tinctorius]